MSTTYNRVHQLSKGRWVAFGGFVADAEQMLRDYKKEIKLFELREERQMTGPEFVHMVGKLA
jgi:20S proteasome alpha/beta subunit